MTDTSPSDARSRPVGRPIARSYRAAGMGDADPPVPLETGEQVRARCWAVRLSGLRARVAFGFLWPSYQQVSLWVTDRRLIEAAAPFHGRAAGRRLRTMSWSDVRAASVSGGLIRIELGDGSKQRWRVAEDCDQRALCAAVEIDRPVAAADPAEGSSRGSKSLCPHCLEEFDPATGRCASCRTRFVTPGEAGRLALLLPGGGHLATGHKVVGTARAIFEVLVFVGCWLTFTDLEWALFVAPIGAIVALALVVFKLEAAATARGFARLVAPWSSRARRRWRIAGIVGGCAMLAWFASAVMMAGQTSLELKNDLEFHNAGSYGWDATYEVAEKGDVYRPVLRSTWTHEDGWVLEVSAEPLALFQTSEEWLEEQEEERRLAGSPPGEPFHLGAMEGVCWLDVESDGSDEIGLLRYAILDRGHRDVHTITCYVDPSDVDEATALITSLIRRAHWTKPGNPCGSKWDAE